MPHMNGVSDPYIELIDGSKFPLTAPETHIWNIEAVAHSLGNQCRYTGNCRHFYSVAEHSVLCSLLAEELGLGDPFEALMHDAHESVISDLASPWKPLVPDYEAIEKACARACRNYYGLPEQTSPECKKLDWIALFLEAYYLLRSKGQDFLDPLKVRPEALRLAQSGHWHLAGLDPRQASTAFLVRFNALKKEGWWKQLDEDDAAQERFLRLS